jgi:hypothetical protein
VRRRHDPDGFAIHLAVRERWDAVAKNDSGSIGLKVISNDASVSEADCVDQLSAKLNAANFYGRKRTMCACRLGVKLSVVTRNLGRGDESVERVGLDFREEDSEEDAEFPRGGVSRRCSNRRGDSYSRSLSYPEGWLPGMGAQDFCGATTAERSCLTHP